jgi:signal transduction histidine kinase/DNA-binding response OmpR family regulator
MVEEAVRSDTQAQGVNIVWLNLPIRLKGLAVIAIPTICLILAIAAVGWLHQTTTVATSWVVHTQQVRLEAQQLQNALIEAETSVRGYDVTGRDDFLDPYTAALHTIPDSLTKLRTLVADNPQQVQRLNAIDVLVQQRTDILKANLQIARRAATRAIEPELAANLSQGKQVMDGLRAQLSAFLAEEERLQAVRDAQLMGQRNLTLAALIGSGIVAIIGGLLANSLFSAGVVKRLNALSENARRLAHASPLLGSLAGNDELSALDRELQAAALILKVRENLLRRTNVELTEQNYRAEEATRLKSEFLANMSHELRTPLNSIIGFAELMHDGKVGPVSADHREYLGDILTSARHLLQLINDVLDLSKIEAGKMEFRPEPLDLAKVVGEVRDILRAMAARKRLQIAIEVDPSIGQVMLDPGKLKQVLYNYLSNALKFTPEEGRVIVRVVPEGDDRLRLEVEDTGIGISAADIGKLFVEFQQLDDGASKKYQGTGLGLALTKQIIEAQDGSVGVRSAPGQGSLFYAVLPRRRTSQASGAAPAATLAAPSSGAPSVLLIEDDPLDLAWLVRVIGEAGYQIEVAQTGAEALEKCRQRRFDAITLDLLLPDMGGWELLHQIRETTPNADAPAIVVTVVAEKEIGLGFPIHDFLVKPVRADDLLASLQRAGVAPGSGSKVLVVDDDVQSLKLIEAMLRQTRISPICRMDGASGLRAAEDERPQAVILDLLMPGMDGFEFLERFRQTTHGRGTPVIVWTNKDLTSGDRLRLASLSKAIVMKSEGGTSALLVALRDHLPGASAAD